MLKIVSGILTPRFYQLIFNPERPDEGGVRGVCGDRDNVTFLGFIDREDLPKLYTTLDVFVFPSRVEAEGLVVLESNACETPVVGANANGLKSTIENGVNGYKYEPGDTEDFRDKVEKVYSYLEELKESSVEKTEEKSVTKSIERLLDYYNKIAN
jgi:1,2-diacylglycerol 3-alpha-glucosyltransferase